MDEPFIERMIVKHQQWTPNQVRERIEEAMAHKSRLKYSDLQVYVQGWLRRDAERNGTGPPLPVATPQPTSSRKELF